MEISSVPLLEATDGVAMITRFYNEFRIEVPLVKWNRHNLTRVSVQGYNTHLDMDKLINALRKLEGFGKKQIRNPRDKF